MILSNNKTYNILFIGNSYTYYNDMPETLFAPIAESAGYKFNAKRVTKGGWCLIDSANPEDEVGALVEAELGTVKYDFVVLQEQSTSPIFKPERFYDGVRKLVKRSRENGAKVVLYGTWGRKSGSDTLIENNWTHESMTWKLSAAYQAIANELGVDLTYVGLAFSDIHTNHENVTDVYFEDMAHPSYSGSYLAALTIFAKVCGVDPTLVTFNGSLSPEVAEMLKEAARKAVFETPEIPEEFKTNSENICIQNR